MSVDSAYVRDFLLGGKCECIIRNANTGNKFEYKIRVSKDNKNMYFVNVRVKHTLVYAGVLNVKGIEYYFNTGKKGTMSNDDIAIKALLYTLRHSNNLPKQIQVSHLGKCSRCGRKLTDEISIIRGLGPECFRKVHKEGK